MKVPCLYLILALFSAILLGQSDSLASTLDNDLSRDFSASLSKAVQGNVLAQKKVADMYSSGKGVGKNKAESFRWWKKAAEAGDLEAQNILADMYSSGDGVAVNLTESMRWRYKTAIAGIASSQLIIGDAYWSGQGLPQSRARAFTWFMNAAGSNDVIASQKAVEKIRDLMKDRAFYNEDIEIGATELISILSK